MYISKHPSDRHKAIQANSSLKKNKTTCSFWGTVALKRHWADRLAQKWQLQANGEMKSPRRVKSDDLAHVSRRGVDERSISSLGPQQLFLNLKKNWLENLFLYQECGASHGSMILKLWGKCKGSTHWGRGGGGGAVWLASGEVWTGMQACYALHYIQWRLLVQWRGKWFARRTGTEYELSIGLWFISRFLCFWNSGVFLPTVHLTPIPVFLCLA